MYIGDYLGRREIYSPDKLAIIDAGKSPELRLTYKQWNRRVNRLANWLRDVAEVEKGDRVAILARDGIEHLDCLFACAKLGAIHTALNWRLHWRENISLVEETTPKVLIYSNDFIEEVTEIYENTHRTLAEMEHYLHIEGAGISGSLLYEEAFAKLPDTPVSCESLEMEDIACLLFTGGTTGLPKGAQISHRQICWNVLNTVIHDIAHDDIYLCVFPLFHTGGLFTYISSQVIFGNTTILVREFNSEQVLTLIEREKVTVFAGVPTMYQFLTQAKNWAEVDLSSLRFCTAGGAPLPVPLVEKFAEEKDVRFKQGFGMTEYGPGLFALPPEDAIRKAGSIGRPNFFVDVRVVDGQGNELGPNEPGELLLKGPSGCTGYWSRPGASTEIVNEDDWFHTGDIVEYDDEWYFYVRDRKKDMYISGGENVYPVEIESVLYKHPAVQMCAVVGIPDEQWGEIGQAFVMLEPDETATPEEFIAHLKENLANYKVPKSVEIRETLPLSGMGKILKRELRDQFIKKE